MKRLDIPALDAATTAACGTIRATLEASSHLIGQNDLRIAAHARTLGAVLVTGDIVENCFFQ